MCPANTPLRFRVGVYARSAHCVGRFRAFRGRACVLRVCVLPSLMRAPSARLASRLAILKLRKHHKQGHQRHNTPKQQHARRPHSCEQQVSNP